MLRRLDEKFGEILRKSLKKLGWKLEKAPRNFKEISVKKNL